MKPITVESQKEKFVISIDKSVMDQDALINLIDHLKMEFLAQKSDINPSVLELGEKIKEDWWNKNKARILSSEE